MAKFVERDQSQLYLLPVDVREWVPEDDLSHFVVEAVNRVPMSAFVVNERVTGPAQYHLRMMLALLVNCYANGIFAPRRIARGTHRDIGVRYVASNCHPDHDTICAFRRDNSEAVAKAFEQVLLLAKELKLLHLGTVSVDGTKVDANANKRNGIRYDRAQELRVEVEALLSRAEQEDSKEAVERQALRRNWRDMNDCASDWIRRARSWSVGRVWKQLRRVRLTNARCRSGRVGRGAARAGVSRRQRRSRKAADQPDGCGQRPDAQEQAARIPSGTQRPGGGGCRRQPVGAARARARTQLTAASCWRTWIRSRRRWVRQRACWRTTATPREARWRATGTTRHGGAGGDDD